MQVINEKDYSIFSALVETIHKKEMKKLRFAKCQECGRLTSFRLIATKSVSIECKNCGTKVPIKTIKQI
jgi:translation initiation factor 2 beta subunit (eIF-2beta)/eIF-5